MRMSPYNAIQILSFHLIISPIPERRFSRSLARKLGNRAPLETFGRVRQDFEKTQTLGGFV